MPRQQPDHQPPKPAQCGLFYAPIMFKNLTIITTTALPDFDVFVNGLAKFAPTTGGQEKSVGWLPPRGDEHGPLAESVNGQWILKFMAETRTVPASVVKRQVAEMAKAIEAMTGRKQGKKEKRQMKEDAIAALLPQAFPRERATWVWVDPTARRVMLDTTSQGVADDIITALVRGIPDLSIQMLVTKTNPATAMAQWLIEQNVDGCFDIGRDCELKSSDETGAKVRYTHHPVVTSEVASHIELGKQPTSLALNWDGRVTFALTDTLQLKKLNFADDVLEKAKAQGQRADDFDGNALMATAELAPLIDDLIAALGGQGPALVGEAA